MTAPAASSSSSSSAPTASYRDLPLAELREKAKIRVKANDFSVKSWINNATRAASEAQRADAQGRIEDAFVGYLKACGFFQYFLDHKSYPKIKAEGPAGPSWHEYMDFSQKRAGYLARAKELSERLKTRDVERQAETTRAPEASTKEQHRSNDAPTRHDGESAPAAADAADTSTGGSIAARLAALRGKGMEVGTNHKRISRDLENGRSPMSPTIPLPESEGSRPGSRRGSVATSIHLPLDGQPTGGSSRSLPAPAAPTTASPRVSQLTPHTSGNDDAPVEDAAPDPRPPIQASPERHPLYRQHSETIKEDDEVAAFSSHFPSLTEFEGNPDFATSSQLLPSLPSVPRSVPGRIGDTAGPGPSPPSRNDFLAAGVPDRPSSLPPPTVPSSPNIPITSPPPTASSPVISAPRPLPKPSLPFTNSITADKLKEYLSNPALNLLIIDTRDQRDFDRDHIGRDEEFGGRKSNVIWIDPTILTRHGLDSTKLEAALALLPSSEQKAFIDRAQNDLVVIYDDQSKSFPTKGSPPTAPSLLFSIIFEHEFRKTLPRSPVLLIGGFEAWKTARSSRTNGDVKGPRPPVPKKPTHSPSASLPGQRNGMYSRSIADNFGSHSSASYQSQPMIPSHAPKSRSGSISKYDGYGGVPAPPPPGHLARKRSDYIDHHNRDYSGYVAPSPSKSIDYPHPRAGVQTPPLAVTTSLERDSRPQANRSASIISFDGLSKLPDMDDVVYWNDVALGISGLKNLGNTCYMNSTIQCLSATYPLARFFRDGSFKREINTINPLGTKGDLAKAFATLISMLWQESYTFLSPVTFRKSITTWAPQFAGTDQHDSQEFLSFLLDGLHEDLNRVQKRPPPVDMSPEREAALETLPPAVASDREWSIYRQRNNSFIVDLFQGQYRNRMECLTCHKTSTTYDAFMYMSLPLPPSKSRVVLQELIDAFVQTEIMEKDDAWNCPRCKCPRRATKSLSIARLPPVLLIHLKRFSTKNGVFWDKSEAPVIFPLKDLDLTRYLPDAGDARPSNTRAQSGSFKFDLFAVSNHMGSLSSGHYTSFVRSSKGWLYCDDSKITPARDNDVVSKPAYILFYKRVQS